MKRNQFLATLGALVLAPFAGKGIEPQEEISDYVGMQCDVYLSKHSAIAGEIIGYDGKYLEISTYQPVVVHRVRFKNRKLSVVASDNNRIVEFNIVPTFTDVYYIKGNVIGEPELYYKYVPPIGPFSGSSSTTTSVE